MTDETIRWFAGIDWGSAKHQVCLLDEAGKVVGEREFAHGGAGLAALCEWVVSMAGDPGSVAVAIEVPHGPVVDALLDRGFAVYAINPKQLDRCATASASRVPRTTGATTPGSQRPGCARIGICSASCWPVTQAWSSSASGRAPRVVAPSRGAPARARAPGQPCPPAALALLPAASRIER